MPFGTYETDWGTPFAPIITNLFTGGGLEDPERLEIVEAAIGPPSITFIIF